MQRYRIVSDHGNLGVLLAAARRLIALFEASQKVAPSDVVYSGLSVFSDARQRTELHPVGCAPTGRVT